MTSTTVTSVKRETAGIPDGLDQHPEFEQFDPASLACSTSSSGWSTNASRAERPSGAGAVQREEVAAAKAEYGSGGQWDIDHNHSELDWVPNELTTVVDVTTADENIADIIAADLVEDIILKAEALLFEDPGRADLSHDFRIELVSCFPDEALTDDEGNHLPMPTAGLALWADATLVRSPLPRCNDLGRTRD